MRALKIDIIRLLYDVCYAASRAMMWLHNGHERVKVYWAKQGKRDVFLYTNVLIKIQIIKCEVIEIVRRVPLPPNGGQPKVLKAVFWKSLTVIPYTPSFCIVLFLSHPSQFYLKCGVSRARAKPQSASAMLPCEAADEPFSGTTTWLTRGLPGFGGVEK